jgi:hypothetical protein
LAVTLSSVEQAPNAMTTAATAQAAWSIRARRNKTFRM